MHTYTHTYIMEYYSVMRKKGILPFATTWIQFEGIVLSEISQQSNAKTVLSHLFVESKIMATQNWGAQGGVEISFSQVLGSNV